MFGSEIRKALIVEILAASLMLALIQPLLKFVWRIVSWASANIYEGLANSVYKEAALGHRNYIDVIFLVLAVGAV